MDKHSKSRVSRFLYYALYIWKCNPRLNLSAVCTVIGLSTLGICALIQTCGLGVAPDYMIEIGKAGFYFGIGGAYEQSKPAEGK